MPLQTTVIGSFPKPDYLKISDWFRTSMGSNYLREYTKAAEDKNKSAESKEKFERTLKKARKEVLGLQGEIGIDVITDGEMARDSYVHYFCRRLKGIDFHKLTEKNSRNGAWIAELPTIVAQVEPRENEPWVYLEWKECQEMTTRPVKMTLPGPMTIINSLFDDFYHDDRDLSLVLIQILNKEIRALAASGCQYIQVDEPLLVRDPDTALKYGIEHLAACFEGVPDTVNKCIHLCCGYPLYLDQQDYAKADPGAYLKIADKLDQAGFDQISIEDAHRHNDLELFKRFKKSKIVLGVLKIACSKLETTQEIKDRIEHVLTVVPADRLVIAPDCGLGFLPSQLAEQKLRNMVEAVNSLH